MHNVCQNSKFIVTACWAIC